MRLSACSILLCGLSAAASSHAALPAPLPQTLTWHVQLNGVLQKPNRTFYDIDLYDTSKAVIANLKGSGKTVICYFSAGTWEDWRPDAALYPKAALGKALDAWPGERWLDIRRADVRALLAKRLDLAVQKGCQGVDPDNVDGYTNPNGLKLTKAQQLDFLNWLADEAHKRQLLVGLKNAIELIPSVYGKFDFALNESCYDYAECNAYSYFRTQKKPVMIIDYGPYSTKRCSQAKTSGYNLQFYPLSLAALGTACK
ncbi:endo alpha-1,4 polygalactosaminidase [Pseudomonas oryzihabitans]|uniref:endo alpha-1,4 polygalactosaminidase n=1 Tax=Pseudomonas oryzihabitans TaxID=47885 RepID=UPI00285D3A91|nr:endo alpha-1,4 polygalactosaminidase [Pseudomonas psychrotolerans]MDR6677139.1 hypothetical protein [Pseudomonas psychrotolerans]